MTKQALWTVADAAKAMRAKTHGTMPQAITGLSIDTRTVKTGEAFFAIQGENRDGHEFVPAALKAGAGVAVVARTDGLAKDAPALVVGDVLEGLADLGRAARARIDAPVVAVTGSVGKTGTKEALRLALGAQGETHASVASYNNHWGVPLSLARMPASTEFGVFELGMNHAGELTPLTKMVRPNITIVTTIEPVHFEFFGSLEAIADAKAEIFLGVEKGGAAILNRDNSQFDRLSKAARAAGIERIVSCGEREGADARLLEVALKGDGSTVRANILGTEVTYKLGAPGRHVALNSLAVLAAVALLDGDLALGALALNNLQPPVGRGARATLRFNGGDALLIDESYNANPASMRAALSLLGQASIGKRGRRIAVLGDMLELGPKGPDMHAALAEAVVDNDIDQVYCAGPLMRALWDKLPPDRHGVYAESSAALEPAVVEAVRAGDAVMVKGSLGSKMAPIVKALSTRYSAER
ncbi:UDP-N-acetylmuramoyl-tripeptide--D-alanyl-D-alanine ligase [Variibacter gotjawalensis]|uniref:UDP-N-acetylmuramoyl-tripeptide--D-alanyl-D-alanine ligase n=1 Tax=Variibacter gotjawalensis TaxID=1333996 RepID=A0A0S3PTR4_9BRAD|nr:UDP-N-acetylmuramoylalanyl-D-glutamyl-2,6-diaminopimelate--D-alanyl-D-alanine ligase [Variibacter gotjawalensis]NIK49626.1 UDP-N-acetylmuramoyl-tripeptide--D-alanyl-D-alanine ligase [Variibacter gotjawalensis]RZS45638.1 UDP-N-acetylmuramoyl-tripeptide--D-alanyl-D-alanine ligase [Variibacter gotjawalensis]BAT59309.1 UDP-N-acetylmuramoyl-tripeptide--D-alanyl-D-alanine ligase [Variibacter gotjawalensis]